MWYLILLFALSAAQDPVRLGITTLLVARPRPIHRLFAYWLGLMATGFGTCLAALFLLRDVLRPAVRVATSIATSPVIPLAQIAVGAIAFSAAIYLWLRSPTRPAGRQPRQRTVLSRLSSASWSTRFESMLNSRSLGPAFAAGLCTSTQVIECSAAMIAILASGAAAVTQVSAALAFTLVAFAIVEIPLVSYLISPRRTLKAVAHLHDWLQAHRRSIVSLVLGTVGLLMVVGGASNI